MWCGHCQSDVAAEVSPDNQRVFCAACGTLLSTIDAPSHRIATDKLGERTKDARELLQRWSSGKVIDHLDRRSLQGVRSLNLGHPRFRVANRPTLN